MFKPMILFLGPSFFLSWAVWLVPWFLKLPESLGYFAASFGPLAGVIAVLRWGGPLARSAFSFHRFSPGWIRGWTTAALLIGLPLGVCGLLSLGNGTWWAGFLGLGLSKRWPELTPLTFFLVMLVSYGICEEIGWRGWLYPFLNQFQGKRKAALTVGIVTVVWHIPALWINPHYRAMGGMLVFWALCLLAGALVLCWLFELSGRSLVPLALWHGGFDFFTASDSSAVLMAPVFSLAIFAALPLAWRGLNRLNEPGSPGSLLRVEKTKINETIR